MSLGKDMEDSIIDDTIKKQQPNQCAMLVYTVSDILIIQCSITIYYNFSLELLVYLKVLQYVKS